MWGTQRIEVLKHWKYTFSLIQNLRGLLAPLSEYIAVLSTSMFSFGFSGENLIWKDQIANLADLLLWRLIQIFAIFWCLAKNCQNTKHSHHQILLSFLSLVLKVKFKVILSALKESCIKAIQVPNTKRRQLLLGTKKNIFPDDIVWKTTKKPCYTYMRVFDFGSQF